jgi:hypothetical protein
MKENQNQNKEPQKILGRLLAALFKGLLIGALKVIVYAIYFSARITETISHYVAEQLKSHINYDR